MFAHIKELFTRPSGYQISRSVRLRSSATAYLNRTPAGAGNLQKWTWSAWVKRGSLSDGRLFYAGASSAGAGLATEILFSTNSIYYHDVNWTVSNNAQLVTTAVFRDPSAWYHIVVAVDTTQATDSNRVLIYVNGVQITSFSTTSYMTQNYSTRVNASVVHNLGVTNGGTGYFDGYMTEINLIDGQQLTPLSFGETDSITGVWKPKKYAGTYGTNGFYLNFSDNSAATAAAIGKDYSGNGNNWTPNNISVTAGATYDSMLDVPTLFADGGNGRGNYAVLNPLAVNANSGQVTFSNGNLNLVYSSTAGYSSTIATIGISSGKWYWEVTQTASSQNPLIGVVRDGDSLAAHVGQTANGYSYYGSNGFKYNNGTGASYGASFVANDVIGVALDMDAGTITFYKNGVSQGQAYSGLSGLFYPAVSDGDTSATVAFAVNFGQRPFTYTPPTGFVALNTQNLPTPTISKGNQYFDATIWTGNGSSNRAIVNAASMAPDWVWIKSRSGTYSHRIFDSVRGANKRLVSNATDAEASPTDELNSFNADGFTVGADTDVNANAATYVGWQWKAGGTSSSNTNGSITSTVSVGATQGFSVVTYTGTGANATVGHGLGVAPKMIFGKNRTSGTPGWPVYHASIGNTGALILNSTAATDTSSAYWNNTSPTSSVFSIGTGTSVNTSTQNYVFYCFSEVAGYSKFGSYTGNGSADGPFVYCGFRPRYVLLKRSDTADAWVVFDSVRGTYNLTSPHLQPHLSSAEADAPPYGLDFLSNGFKCRASTASMNASGGTYIFMAFAENPTKFSLAR